MTPGYERPARTTARNRPRRISFGNTVLATSFVWLSPSPAPRVGAAEADRGCCQEELRREAPAAEGGGGVPAAEEAPAAEGEAPAADAPAAECEVAFWVT